MTEEDKINEKIKEHFEEFQKEEVRGELDFKKVYDLIDRVIRQYCDLREDYYNLLVLWVIGTWMHDKFPSFPFLFFNAMKGSGKSRLLKLLASMSKNGKVMANMSEAVLFRTAQNSSIFIDEFEGVAKKNSNTLRELLNAAYKQGTYVERAFKHKSMKPDEKGVMRERDEISIESFNVYCPIAMCNIYGMESVLSDRCITLIIEKSDKPIITKLIETFKQDPVIKEILHQFSTKKCSYVDVVVENNIEIDHWNTYILSKYNNYTTTYTTITTETTQTTLNQKEFEFFNKVDATGIDSRHLELFLPLFVLAQKVSNSILEETIVTAKKIVEERKGEDLVENRDVAFLEFLANSDMGIDFVPVTDLVTQFKNYIHEEDEDGRTWVSNKWVGWALRRLNLLIDKKRTGQGMEVMVNFSKVKEKVNMLRPKNKLSTSE